MYTTRMTIPLNFQDSNFNCQSLLDALDEDYESPERKSAVDGAFVVEWDFEDEDQSDAWEFKGTLESFLDDNDLEDDPEDANYSGIHIGVFTPEGRELLEESEDEDEEDEDDDSDDEDDGDSDAL